MNIEKWQKIKIEDKKTYMVAYQIPFLGITSYLYNRGEDIEKTTKHIKFMIIRTFMMVMGGSMVILLSSILLFVYRHRKDKFTVIFHIDEEEK